MSAVRLLPDPVQGAGAAPEAQSTVGWPGEVPTLNRGVRTLLDDVRSGRLSTASAGDRWLVRRIEEALVGFDDISELAVGEEVDVRRPVGHPAGTASISAGRVAG